MSTKVKTPPLIIAALIINAISWASFAYESYTSHNISLGIIYTVLFTFMVVLTVWSLMRNKKIKTENENEQDKR